LTVFHEIWSEHSLIDMKQNRVANSFILNTFLMVASNATGSANFSIVERDRSIKKTNKNTRKCWHTFGDWRYVINTAQLFCMNDRIWYPINSLECQWVILELMGSAAFGKQKPKQNIILSNSILYNFPSIYSLWGFPWKQPVYEFVSGGHPRRFEVTLKTVVCCDLASLIMWWFLTLKTKKPTPWMCIFTRFMSINKINNNQI